MGKVLQAYFESTRKNNSADCDFDWFWDSYPRKRSRLDALKAWRQTAGSRPAMDELIAALDKQAMSDDWNRDGGQYIPYPATWLRKGCWADE